ncbi:MAG: cyclodeaminase/cyclohydrolase family protein [Lachnospiraceae bacterium]|nr:cyclodeaminase/cyclohydrolase family protein [Lachnospiraceae bacterium]
MGALKEETLENFTAALASSAPVPGGGGVSALVGALAVSLGSMTASLTVGKKRYADVEDRMKEMISDAEELRSRLLGLIDEDAEGFSNLMEVMKMPRTTEEERSAREFAMDGALKMSGMVPLKIMRSAADVIDLLEEIADKGSRAVLSDAGCGASLARSAMECAALNVYANTKYMKDREAAKKMNTEVIDLLDESLPLAEDIYKKAGRELTEQIRG